METYITIGEIIRHYRKEKGMSQEALAQGICDRKYISNVENNKNIPTLDIINQLSDRLGINLYETYALMLRHHDLATHKKIEFLNKHFTPDHSHELLSLVEEYEKLPEFQYGEPLQTLKYAKSVYYSFSCHDYAQAILIAKEGISINNIFEEKISTLHFSNIELALLNAIAVNYCRISEIEEGKKYFDLLQKYMHQLFSESHFATNRNNQFELRFLSNLVYNYFIFFRKEPSFDSQRIEYVLKLLKSLHCHHNLPELLLCKAYLQVRDGDVDVAKQTYSLAHQLGLYLYSEDFQNHIEKTTLAEYFERLT